MTFRFEFKTLEVRQFGKTDPDLAYHEETVMEQRQDDGCEWGIRRCIITHIIYHSYYRVYFFDSETGSSENLPANMFFAPVV